MVYFLLKKLISTQQDVQEINTYIVQIDGNISSLNETLGNATASISAMTINVFFHSKQYK
jgi:hypothetical protein